MTALCLTLCLLSAPSDPRASPPFTPPKDAYFTKMAQPQVDSVRTGGRGGPVILIVVDAMRPDRLSAYGAQRDTTPNLARLAAEGVALTRYFVNGNWTRPSTATLLTGLPPAAHGVERETDRLADDFTTLAEVLGGAGIPTGAVVGNGNAGSAFGLARGFDFYADTVKHWRGLPSAEQVVELAIPYVRQHAAMPFFLMLFFVDPHDPYHAPGQFADMFVNDPHVPLIASPHWEARPYRPPQVARMQATYDGALRYTDTVLGRFFATLRALGVYDKATILVTADHGEAFGEHGAFLHSHHLYDEIIRAPLIVRAPDMDRRGVAHAGLFQTLDLLPTLAAHFRAQLPKAFPGIDMFAALADAKLLDPERRVVSEFNNFGIHRRALLTYDKKLIFESPADSKEFAATVGNRALLPSVHFNREDWQAFDLRRDPFERSNLWSKSLRRQSSWARLVDEMRALPRMGPRRTDAPVVGHIDNETYQDLRSLGYVQ